MKKNILFIFSFLFVLMLSGCNKIDEFNTIESITLKVGDVHNLVIDYDQTKKVKFEYSSYDSNIINLNQGTITALSEGTTSIIITEKHSGIKKIIDIIVEKVNENIIADFTVKDSIRFYVGMVYTLVVDYDLSKKVNFEYKSTDESIAAPLASCSNVIEGYKEGKTSIIVKEKYSGIEKIVSVEVEKMYENIITDFTVEDNITIQVGQVYILRIEYDESKNVNFEYKSTDESIAAPLASCSNVIEGYKEGKTSIIVKEKYSGIEKIVSVEVEKMYENIITDFTVEDSITIQVRLSYVLRIEYDESKKVNFEYKSTDESIAAPSTFSPNRIEGYRVGKTSIIVKEKYSGIEKIVNVEVDGRYIYLGENLFPMPGEEIFTLGNGSKESPYIIDNKEKLIYLSNQVNIGLEDEYYYELSSDINLEGMEWTPIGISWLKPFNGYFNGNGYEVRNYTIFNKLYESNANGIGLFGYNTGTIENLGITNYIIDIEWWYEFGINSDVNAGGIAGYNQGIIKNSYSIGNIILYYYDIGRPGNIGPASTYSGGISGYNEGTISNCYSLSNIDIYGTELGDICVGGITTNGIVENCLAIVSKNIDYSGSSYYISESLIGGEYNKNCYAYFENNSTNPQACNAEELNDPNFYIDKLFWDNEIWDLENINFVEEEYLDNCYPKLIRRLLNKNKIKYTYEEINLWAYESSEEVSVNRDVLVYYDYKLPIIKNVEELNSFLELHNFANQRDQNLEGNFDKFDETFFKEKSIIVFATMKPQTNYRYIYNDLKVENEQLVLDVVYYSEGSGLFIVWPLTNVFIFDKEDVSKYNEILVGLKRQN